MLRGLYSAYTGMINQQNRMDIITNNLANAATIGFKKEGATSQSFDKVLALKIHDGSVNYTDHGIGMMRLGVKIGETYTNWGQGSFRETGEDYDLAIGGNGFFTISYSNKEGQEYTLYTRDGSFSLTKEGYLVTKDGDFVLGSDDSPIQLDTTLKYSIDSEGNIFHENTIYGKLKITDFEDYDYLDKFGENLYQLVDGGKEIEATGDVYQGYIEQSNVQTVEEMVNMITVQRAYEAAQRVETSMDGILERTVNLGSV